MKKLIHIAVLGFCAVTALVQAEDTLAYKTHDNAIEEVHLEDEHKKKIKHCFAETKGMKGDEHKKKLMACLNKRG